SQIWVAHELFSFVPCSPHTALCSHKNEVRTETANDGCLARSWNMRCIKHIERMLQTDPRFPGRGGWQRRRHSMPVTESKRRYFLKGALAAGAAAGTTLVAPKPARAQTGGPQPASAATPSAPTAAAETMGSNDQPMPEPGKHVANPGSDFMVDVF